MKKAFTLIELLVVIAIIAILAAILFPVFAQAKAAAKKTADLNNSKQIGIGMQLYLSDSDDMLPPANHRVSPSNIQEVAWTWMVLPYMKSEQIFVSPSDTVGGWAPGCFDASTNNRGFGVPAIQQNGCVQQGYPAGLFTLAVARSSFVANQVVIGRKRQDSDTSNVVSATAIEGVSETIMLASTTESQNCMRNAVGGESRSYRPAWPIARSGQRTFSGSSAPAAGDLPLQALTIANLELVFACRNSTDPTSTPDHTIRYSHYGRFGNGNNYVFCDTSAKFQPTMRTMDPTRYMWGKAAYSVGASPIINSLTGLNVQ